MGKGELYGLDVERGGKEAEAQKWIAYFNLQIKTKSTTQDLHGFTSEIVQVR